MALSKEDKGDVQKHLGKALANKVSKVTRDSTGENRSRMVKKYGAVVVKDDENTWKSRGYKVNKNSGLLESTKSKALKGKGGFDHEQHRKHNQNIDAIDKKFGIGRHDPRNYSK